jgi:hypothetical protein
MDTEDRDIESQRHQLVVDTGGEEFLLGVRDLPAFFIGIRLGTLAFELLHIYVIIEFGL